ncbi:MAG: hypothetical protein HY735_26220 [Verrucomicrobia bacterium]|nr:hypothetical protein [Verrucomicrobiota bacterium]
MKLVTIVAGSAAEALAEVHRRLGPEAVVVNVRKAPAPGLSRIWKKPQIEVQATLPNPKPSLPKPSLPKPDLVELGRQIVKLKEQRAAAETLASRKLPAPPPPETPIRPESSPAQTKTNVSEKDLDSSQDMGLGKMLERLGILPLHAQWLVDQIHSRHFGEPSKNLREQFGTVQDLLVDCWRRLAAPVQSVGHQTRILVGTPGVGKTTCLCKWLTQEVLFEKRSGRVLRLDGHIANTAEFLSIHGEILGVPVDRVWPPDASLEENPQVQFVDLPGVPPDDTGSITALGEQIAQFQPAQVLLVLNAAYDLDHLVAHVRAFADLRPSGLVLTHLDEDSRWSKFWNLLLSTNLPALYLSGGQNIPGDFKPASPTSVFDIGLGHEVG